MKRSLGAKTLVYPTPVLVVGTYDKAGKPNAMTAAWGGIATQYRICRECDYRVTRDVTPNGFHECWGPLADTDPNILDLYQLGRITEIAV